MADRYHRHSLKRVKFEKRLALPLLALSLTLAPVQPGVRAHSYKLGEISIGHMWAPPSDGTNSVPVYGPILNQGATTTSLNAIDAPVAGSAGVKSPEETAGDDVVGSVDFLPGKPFAFAPWRKHIWLTELERPLKAGDSFPMTLTFEDIGDVVIEVEVESKQGHQ